LPITPNAYSSLGNITSGAPFLAEISDATAACSYALNPPSLVSYGVQALDFSVTAPSGCTWTASPSDSSWISIQSGSTGKASGIVTAALTANNTGSTRTGNISVNGQFFSIIQAASSCTYPLSGGGTIPASGGTVQLTVSAPAGCPWSVVPPSPFVSVVSGGSGTGTGTVTLSLPANHSVQWLNPVVQVGPQSVLLSEANSCAYTLAPLTFGAQEQSGSITVTANHAGCSWFPESNQSWLTVSGSGTGSGTFPYTIQANTAATGRAAVITLDNRQFTVKQAGQ
jgi:trimeric autotransporter adhesin